MNIMLSAYACEPCKGSEPAVGWNWAVELSKLGNEVTVLTRENNRSVIEKYISENNIQKIDFIFYDLPVFLQFFKKWRGGIYLYYNLWQIGIYFKVRSLLKKERKIDLIHHVTFATVRQPSFLGLLGIPFILGPVGGGEKAPYKLRKSFPVYGMIKDLVRDIANKYIRISPLMWLTFFFANKIIVTSEQSKDIVPFCFHYKVAIKLAIGIERDFSFKKRSFKNNDNPRLLYVGKLLYWKGIHLAIKSFSGVLKDYPGARFTIVGKGPDKKWLLSIAEKLKIDDSIDWIDWCDRNSLIEIYNDHDLFVFPSLHDSGGIVVLEALKNYLPVVCLDLGGPGSILNDSCGESICTFLSDEVEVVSKIKCSLIKLLNKKSTGKFCYDDFEYLVSKYEWPNVVNEISAYIKNETLKNI